MVRSSNPRVILKDLDRSIERAVDTLLTDINTNAKQATPIRTGRAARGWRKVGSYNLGRDQTVIENKVPYIGLLDRGYSRQAPRGILEPVISRLAMRRTRL
jgi:hypothetical protein